MWWNKGTRQTGESGGYVTSWGGSRSSVMDLSRLKMVNIRVNLFGRCAAGMWEEVTLGHTQRTIISYLETLSVTQLDGQEPALTQTECVSFNRHAFMYVTSLCLPSLQNIWPFHILKIQKSITYGSVLSVHSYCNVKDILVVFTHCSKYEFSFIFKKQHICFVKGRQKHNYMSYLLYM